MDPDLLLVIGLVIGGLSFFVLVQTFTDGRPPRTAALMVLLAVLLCGIAINRNTAGYTWDEVPDVFVRVFQRYFG